jgi:hypothetical protein
MHPDTAAPQRVTEKDQAATNTASGGCDYTAADEVAVQRRRQLQLRRLG